ncbi:MAG: TetR/AcrR family transcriptional regulator [Rhodobacterales bacterium]|nr:TetR/AcrR family transcriptional regulator [Rhodobacterales bacterium]
MAKPNSKKRLTPEDWIFAGFRALALHGPSALKAESLARALKTTKGSFYWHFADVPDFHRQMLVLWRQRAYDSTVEALQSAHDPEQRLIRLGEMAVAGNKNATHGGSATEFAIRAWAQTNADAHTAVIEIDRQRLDYIESILVALGTPNPDHARLIYGAFVGMEILSAQDNHDNTNALDTLIRMILTQSNTAVSRP